MFRSSAYPAPVLRWRQGPVMSGFLTFMDRYRDEAACIAALAELRWPNGFICAGCAGRLAYQLGARPEYPLDGLIEIDESYYGGRGKPASRGRGLTDPNKSLMAIAVETVPASPRQGEGIKQSQFVAGSARIAILPAATAADLGGF